MRFFNALGSEFLKIFTTRMWWLLLVVMVAYVGIVAGGLGALFGWIATDPEAAARGGGGGLPPGADVQPLIYSFATSVGYVFPVLLGALATTGEFRHETLTPTFLAIPRRGVVLTAKSLAILVMGVVFGVLAWVSTVGIGAGVLSAYGLETQLTEADTWYLVGRGVLAMALWAAIGVGLGVLVKSQVAAIVIVLAFTQFVEPLLRLAASFIDITANIAKFLPGAASDALVGSSFFAIAGAGQAESIEWWQGGLVLLAYAVLATVAGYFTTWRKDVT